MPAAHECARKTFVFVITFTQFLCKHKFDIFLVWGAGARIAQVYGKLMLRKPARRKHAFPPLLSTKKGRMPSFCETVYHLQRRNN